MDYAEQLRNTIDQLESRVVELSYINSKQGEQLTHVLSELREATELVGELRDNNERAIELVRRSNARLIEFERTVGATGTTIEGLIARQHLIDRFVREQSAENRELRATLGIRD
jgi:uncharacterized coiled-coil protein SlyX